MSYVSNPYAAKARFDAAKLVVKDGLKITQVARMYGVNRSTLFRWVKRFPGKTRKLNQYGHFIPTESSAPKSHPNQVKTEIVDEVIRLRKKIGRCAPVIHAHLLKKGFLVSERSVGRILKREGLVRKKRNARYYKSIHKRPEADTVGALVQMDTIHYMKSDGSRFYLYTLIDVYSRLAYVEYFPKLSQQTSFEVILRAQEHLKITFSMIQTDHGPEFKEGLTFLLSQLNIKLRHSRVRKPNDNAHIERFNRTIQEECFGGALPKEDTIKLSLKKYVEYYNSHRLHLSLDLLTPTQFVAKVLS